MNKTVISTLSSIGALAIAIATPAFAQTAQPVPETPAPTATPAEQGTLAPDDATATPDVVSDVIVTGSRIRGIKATGSNIIAIDQAKIAEEPVTSTADLLRRVPQVVSIGANRNGGSSQNGSANATRGAGINLRGIGTNATLLLYDGKRFPPQGTQGQFTDPSVLPTIALGRVEVVADGASAIYGSDAIAGVVNFILRKNFDGFEVRGHYGFTDGNYDEAQTSAIAGKTWSTGWAMIAGEYTRNSALRGYDLPWYQNDNRALGGRDLRVTTCNPGTITAGGRTYAIPVGGVTKATAGSLVAGTTNRCFYNTQDSVIPEQQRYSVVSSVSQNIGDRIRIFADGFYSRRNGIILGTSDTFSATVPSTNPFFVSPVAGATSVTVGYSLLPELGADRNPYHASSYNVSGGVEAKLFSDWRATAYYAHGASNEVADRRLGVNTAALNAALADTNPATALNLFGGVNNPATLAKIHDNLFIITGRTRLDVINGQVDGSLFALPGGNVRLAVGGEHRTEYTYTGLITGQASGTRTNVQDSGSRTVTAAFGELYVPFFGDANRHDGLEELSLSVAGRFEHYSDFGNTTNPKVGLTYKPFPGLSFKGSYGTSFRAPTFTEVSTIAGGAGLYFDTLPDTTSPTGTTTGIGIAGGNPQLKPETAKTWSFGVNVAPPEIPGLVIDLTYFRIDYTNQIQALRGTTGILTNPLYSSFVIRNPTAAQVSSLIASGLPINNTINPALVTFIVDGRRQNLGTSKVRGLDFGIHYDWSWDNVKLDAGIQGTQYLSYQFEAVPGAGFTSVIGTLNFPQEFRAQADFGVKVGPVRGRATLNHLSGYSNNTITPAQHVKQYNTVDLSVSLDVMRNLTLSVDGRNLFNQNPPFVDTTLGYDPQSANPVPRLLSISAAAKF